MKTKRKTKPASSTRFAPTELGVLLSIERKLSFLCEAVNRAEVRAETSKAQARKFAAALLKLGTDAGVIPAEIRVAVESAFSDENQN